MPYSKKPASKPRTAKHYALAKRKPNSELVAAARKLARREALSVVRQQKELKYFIKTVGQTTLQYNTSVPFYVNDMMAVSQGTGISGFSGHSICMKYLRIKCILDNKNNSSQPVAVRLAVLKVKEGAAYTDYTTGTAIFEVNNGDQSMGTYSGCLDIMARWNQDRYTPVVDEFFTMAPTNQADSTFAAKEFKINLNNMIRQTYASGAKPVVDNYLFIAMARRTSGTDVTSDGPDITFLSELVYTEY